MKIYIRDILLVIVIFGMGLAWWKDHSHNNRVETDLRLEMANQEASLRSLETTSETAHREANVLAEEVRRLRSVIRSSLDDQRRWFELEVRGNELVAIKPGTSDTDVLTLDTVKRIEAATGMKAQRLRHLLTPISELEFAR